MFTKQSSVLSRNLGMGVFLICVAATTTWMYEMSKTLNLKTPFDHFAIGLLIGLGVWFMLPYILLLRFASISSPLIAGLSAITYGALSLAWYWRLLPPNISAQFSFLNLFHPIIVWVVGLVISTSSQVTVFAAKRGLRPIGQIALFVVTCFVPFGVAAIFTRLRF